MKLHLLFSVTSPLQPVLTICPARGLSESNQKRVQPCKVPRGSQRSFVFRLASVELTAVDCSDDGTISRGTKAIDLIYGMTSRISYLVQQSHLETGEGKSHRATFSRVVCADI